MSTTTPRPEVTFTEAFLAITKLGASVTVKGVGGAKGGVVSLGSTVHKVAKENPEGFVGKALSTSLADQFREATDYGYNLMEDGKAAVTFASIKESKGDKDENTKTDG